MKIQYHFGAVFRLKQMEIQNYFLSPSDSLRFPNQFEFCQQKATILSAERKQKRRTVGSRWEGNFLCISINIRKEPVQPAGLIGLHYFCHLSAEQTAHAAHVSLPIVSSTFGTSPSTLLYCVFFLTSEHRQLRRRAASLSSCVLTQYGEKQSHLLFIFTGCVVSSTFITRSKKATSSHFVTQFYEATGTGSSFQSALSAFFSTPGFRFTHWIIFSYLPIVAGVNGSSCIVILNQSTNSHPFCVFFSFFRVYLGSVPIGISRES